MTRSRFAFRAFASGALILTFALAVGCGDGDDAPKTAAKPAPAASPPPPAEPESQAPPSEPPAAEPEVTTIDLAAGDAARGAAVYGESCATCHGPTGDGDGPLSATLDPKPARHSDGAYMNALSDEHLVRVIRDGGPAVGKSALMAPWGGLLSDAQIADVVAFLRSIADPPYPGSAG